MTHNTTLRLLLLLLCLAAILTSVSSCSKHVDQPSKAAAAPVAPDYYFSRVRFFKDNRKPATDTTWTLHLTTATLVTQYRETNGYVYNETSTFKEVGVLWSR